MHTLIIAEAGVNHNGNLDLALEMVHEAKLAGADIIKFQTGIPEKLLSKYAEKAEYQKETTGSDESQLEMIKKLMLPFEDFKTIKNECELCGIQFLSTPFDLDSIDFLNSLGIPFWKLPSGEVTNLPYLIKIAQTHKPVVMSTGMCTLEDVKLAVDVLKKYGCSDITLLQCNTQYPTPYKDVNLRAMITMKNEFGVKIGYSDHTQGIEIPIAAVALGAEIIEKHFTLDRNMDGPDHHASIEPNELKVMVKSIRNVELSLGNGIKAVSDSEYSNLTVARKSIVASKNIKKGELFTESNITVKRPGNGISPMKWFDVIGVESKRDFQKDELINI